MKRRGFNLARWNSRHTPPRNSGFTIVEVLVAIAIMGILVAIAVPSFLSLVDETKINLLAEQIRQSLKEGQWQAISEAQSYSVTFRQTEQGLQVSYFPVGWELEPPAIMPSSPSPNSRDDSEPGTWHKLSTSIPPDQLVFAMPESPNNTITFLPEGEVEYASKVFLAIGTLEKPRVNTRRCISTLNSESGSSYFQINKDLACDLSPNASPHVTP